MITEKDIDEIMEFCYKNNTIPMKDLFKSICLIQNLIYVLQTVDGVIVCNSKNFWKV